MKKQLLLVGMFCILTVFTMRAQDTIVAWTFPTGTLADSVANAGISSNIGTRTLMHEGGTGVTTMVPGDGTYAEEVAGWDNGDSTKFWSIKFKAEGYHDLVLYSKQMSDGTLYGPRDWRVQYKWGSIPWTNVPGGTVVCNSAWNMGVVDSLPIPIAVPGGTSIYIRWIMTSNIALDMNPVLPTGKSAIDNIIIMGTADLPVATGDTIIGFNFADTTDVEFNADYGLANNLTYDIRAENDSAEVRTLTYTNGATDYAATAEGWDNGANFKFWSIKFKADDYYDMKVWSKQRSGQTYAGPKFWKLQYKLGGSGTWTDVPGGNITVANDWTTGVLNEVALPADINDPGTTSVYLRWVMTSNESISGADVVATGISKIDDIIVTGTYMAGMQSIIYDNNVNVYPNPCNDVLNIESSEEIVKTEVYNMMGALVYNANSRTDFVKINVDNFDSGLYVVVLHFANESKVATRKILVD